MKKDVDRALSKIEHRKKRRVVLQINGRIHVLDADKIYYVEGKGRKAKLVTEGGALETYEKLCDLMLRLNSSFIQSHKSYIVNMDYVKECSANGFLMKNGDLIPISQSKRKEVRQSFFHYISGEQDNTN